MHRFDADPSLTRPAIAPLSIRFPLAAETVPGRCTSDDKPTVPKSRHNVRQQMTPNTGVVSYPDTLTRLKRKILEKRNKVRQPDNLISNQSEKQQKTIFSLPKLDNSQNNENKKQKVELFLVNYRRKFAQHR